MRHLFPSPSVLFLVAGLGTFAALAQPAPAATPPARPCDADLARLCPGVQPGHGRIRACLEGKTDQISPECKAHLDQGRQHLRAVEQACQGDVAKFCADVKPGAGRLGACLRAHESELSEACKAQRPPPPAPKP